MIYLGFISLLLHALKIAVFSSYNIVCPFKHQKPQNWALRTRQDLCKMSRGQYGIDIFGKTFSIPPTSAQKLFTVRASKMPALTSKPSIPVQILKGMIIIKHSHTFFWSVGHKKYIYYIYSFIYIH